MPGPTTTTGAAAGTGPPATAGGAERQWPGYLALWTAFGTTIANEVVRHFAEYGVAPPRPNYPLAPWSLWLVAIVGVACGAVALLDRRPGLVARIMAAGLAALGVISAVVAAVTSEWPAPASTIHADPLAWLLLGFAAAGTVLAVSVLPGEALMRQLFAVGVLLAVLSIIAVVIRFWAVPTAAQDPIRVRPGTLPAQGIYMNINILGMIMGGALVLQAAYLKDAWQRLTVQRRWLLLVVGPLTSLVLVWASSSRTAIAAVCLALGVAMLLPWQRWRDGWPIALFIAGCTTVVLAPIVVTLGLGFELNGRRNLWTMVLAEIGEHPLVGRGFGNINGEQHAHNQILETWLHAGALGVLVLIALSLVGAAAAVRAAPWDGKVGVAIVSYTALLWGTEIISPWAVFRTLPLPLLFSLIGLLAALALARDRRAAQDPQVLGAAPDPEVRAARDPAVHRAARNREVSRGG